MKFAYWLSAYLQNKYLSIGHEQEPHQNEWNLPESISGNATKKNKFLDNTIQSVFKILSNIWCISSEVEAP